MASSTQPLLVRSFIVLGPHGGGGLTAVSSALVRALRRLGVHAVGMKPLAREDELRQLAAASALGLPARALCGALDGADGHAAPTLERVVDTFRALATWADAVVVDGAYGAGFDSLALARTLRLPFVYVVGTAAEAAVADAHALVRGGLDAVGWLGERDLPMPGEWLGSGADHLTWSARRLPQGLEPRA